MEKNRYKYVIFDLDGTLLNTIEDITDALNIAFLKNGFKPYTIQDVKYFVGSGVDTLVKRSLDKRSISSKYYESVKNIYLDEYMKCQRNKTRPYEGIIDLLEILKREGIRMAVVSNKPQIDTAKVVYHFFGKGIFDVIIGAKEGMPLKPNPEVIYEVMAILGADNHNTLYVGDSDIDMKTALNANLRSAGCTWGFRTMMELVENKASYIVNSPLEILKIMDL
ncbi:MAG: HAD family hydrolase [Bacilli bacterium]|nr:HAD family hydrolase [Bacilli bacterium]